MTYLNVYFSFSLSLKPLEGLLSTLIGPECGLKKTQQNFRSFHGLMPEVLGTTHFPLCRTKSWFAHKAQDKRAMLLSIPAIVWQQHASS